MSQPDGSYKNVAAPITCYCHGAAAAVLNTQGYADIVVVDPYVNKQPFMLINNKDGTFKPDYTKMPGATAPVMFNIAYGRQIYSVELIDFNSSGKFDLWFGGIDDNSNSAFAASIFTNTGTDNYTNAVQTVLPSATGAEAADTNPLDIVYLNGAIYLSRVNIAYSEYSIQKIDYKTLSQSEIYSHVGPYADGDTTIEWLTYYNGYLTSLNGIDHVSIAINSQ